MESYKDICHISEIIEMVSLVALVEVLRVREHGARIEVQCLEIYKGQMPNRVVVRVPTLWGKYGFDWFKKGERAVIFASGTDNPIASGPVGRMPLCEVGGKIMAESFADDKSYLEGLTPIEKDRRILVDWDRLREFLMSQRG